MTDKQKYLTENSEKQGKVVETKVFKMDKLIERIEKKLFITNLSIPILRKYLIHKSSGSSRYKYETNGYVDFSEKLHSLLYRLKDGTDEIIGDNNEIIGTKLIELKRIYTQDNFYIFESDEGVFFNADILDFDKNGIGSESFKVGKPEVNTESNLVKNFAINNENDSLRLLKDGNITSTLVGDLFTVIDKDSGDVIIVNNNLIKYINIDENGIQTPLSDSISHNFGVIEKIRIDKNSNFLLIISKYEDGNHKLHILNRKTLEEIPKDNPDKFNDIIDILQVDNKNDLVCLDKNGLIIQINTNFDQFPNGFIENGVIGQEKIIKVQNLALSSLNTTLLNGGIKVNPGDLINGKNQINSNTDDELENIISQIWETTIGEKTLKQLFEEAQNEDEIGFVYNALLKIKSNPSVSAVSGITDSIESKINLKKSDIKIRNLKSSLETLKNTFDKNEENLLEDLYFSNLLALKIQLNELIKNRSQIFVIDQNFDKELSKLTNLIEIKIISFRLQNEERIKNIVDESIAKLKSFLSSIIYLSQITQIYNNDLYKETENLINYLDEDNRNTYRNKLKELVSKRISEIGELEKSQKTKEELNLKQKIKEITENIGELEKIIGAIEDEENLESLKQNDSLVHRIKYELEDLPKKEAEKLLLSLDSIFNKRSQEIRMKKLDSKGIVHSLDEYGIDTSLYYSDRIDDQIGFKIFGNRLANGNIRIELHYEDGTIFNLDKFLEDSEKYADAIVFDDIETEMTQNDFIKLQQNISKYKKSGKEKIEKLQLKLSGKIKDYDSIELINEIKKLKKIYNQARAFDVIGNSLSKKLNINPRSKLELPNPKFIILDEERELLNKISNGLSIQKEHQKGIDILEGPPGLGKTEICKFLASVTNREIIRVQCSKMDPSDLFFSPQLKAGETTRQPAEWIKLMQKPGTIILFDEIDKLNSQSFERLHSLFDGARSIYDPQIGSIKANSDCLFLGTRNSYEKMSNPIVSRSTIIEVKSPSELNEAYKISKYTNIEFFEKLSFDEFRTLYNEENNNKTDVNSKKIYEILTYLKGLVEVFNELRNSQKSDDFDKRFEYEISYRDAEQIFLRYNKSNNKPFKNVFLEILGPKARAVVLDNEDKEKQEQIINDIVKKKLDF